MPDPVIHVEIASEDAPELVSFSPSADTTIARFGDPGRNVISLTAA
jgi:hypothetical protein